LQRPPFTTRPQLVDGGVYDNLGLETVYKRHQTVLVSNAGAPLDFDGDVPKNWVGLGARVIGLVDNQVLSLRKRLLMHAFRQGERHGAFWDIEQDIAVHGCSDALPCPYEFTRQLAKVATDLAQKDERTQDRLINWGYALCDAALRGHLNPSWPAPIEFPYPAVGVG
jgi:NTE family protein